MSGDVGATNQLQGSYSYDDAGDNMMRDNKGTNYTYDIKTASPALLD